MPKWLVQFKRTDTGQAGHREVVGNDETQARIRFLNMSDISFQPVDVISIAEVAEDTSKSAKVERVTKRKVGQLAQKGWREDVAKLEAEINDKAEEKQKLIRRAKTDADWLKVDALQEEIRKTGIARDKLVRANAPGAAKA